jgi:23S rRNA pseudouridine1911/1915/1917 synthase
VAILTFTGVGGQRLDHFLQTHLPAYSRERLKQWIKSGRVRVDDHERKPSFELKGGETVEVEPAEVRPLRAEAEDVPLEVIYEDADVLAINKPAGMVVHAGAGAESGTLVNAVLGRFRTLSTLGGELRPGIVHRLDKDTSGVILIARHDAAHRALARQFAERSVEKTYWALVHGLTAAAGTIEKPIARDPVRRIRMTTRLASGRAAITHWRRLEALDQLSFLEVQIGTGRTHQIRVHLASIGHPVVGDTLYGAPRSPLGRFFLHAHRIEFASPTSGVRIAVAAPLAPELADYLAALRGLKIEA